MLKKDYTFTYLFLRDLLFSCTHVATTIGVTIDYYSGFYVYSFDLFVEVTETPLTDIHRRPFFISNKHSWPLKEKLLEMYAIMFFIILQTLLVIISAKLQSLTFDQKLDHFNVSDRRTFPQRYFILDDYWIRGNNVPIMLYLGK